MFSHLKNTSLIIALCATSFLVGTSVLLVTNATDTSLPSSPAKAITSFQFIKNLSIGMALDDVRELQLFLNKDSATQVALQGPGSPGNENTFFGTKTKDAVIRFQQKYRTEVLDPYGINLPTGFVGPATRQKINALIASSYAENQVGISSNTPIPSIAGGPLPLPKELFPKLYSVIPYQAKRGDVVTLTGDGFELQNTIYIGNTVFDHVAASNGSTLKFTLPTTYLQNGTYDVWVTNQSGTSASSTGFIKLTITDSPQPQPTIQNVSPATTTLSETVTVTGTGFSSTDNTIVSSFGTSQHFPSTGTSLFFSPSQLLSSDILNRIPKGVAVKVDFYIVTPQGPTATAGSFNLQL